MKREQNNRMKNILQQQILKLFTWFQKADYIKQTNVIDNNRQQ